MAGWEFHVKHDAGSLVIEIKGDPERMRARQEAIDAFLEFRRKARAAGMTPGCLLRHLIMGGSRRPGTQSSSGPTPSE